MNQVSRPTDIPWERLGGLVGFICVVAFVFWQSAQWTWKQELERLEQQTQNELQLHMTALRGKLEKHEYLAQLLTTKEDLSLYLRPDTSSDDLQQLNLTLDSYRVISGVSDIYLMDADGWTVSASNWWRPDSFIGQNFSFRPYFQMAMAGEKGRFFGLGTTSGARGYYFSYPVYIADQVVGTLVVKIEIHAIEEPWRDPRGELLVTDADGVVFISSRPEWRLSTLTALSETELDAISDSLRYAGRVLRPLPITERQQLTPQAQRLTIRMRNEQTQEYLMLSQSMPEADWDVHMIKNLDQVRVQAIQVSLLAAAGVILLGLIWLYFHQRRRGQAEKVAWQAEAHRALQQAHDELESRVAARTADLSASNQRLLQEIQQHEQTESALRKTQRELIQTAKLAVLGQLSASINHELNQPLAALRSYAENARTFIARNKPETADSNLEQILQLTERMAEISAQLKMFSRKSGEQLVPVSVQAAAEYAMRLYAGPLAQQNVRVLLDFPEEEVFVLADMVRLEQVLVNLLSNALHALKSTPQPCLRIHAYYEHQPEKDWVVIQVWDTGPGIPSHQLDEIFDPFFTSKEPGQGLGLGLSISSRIATELNGELRAANHSGFILDAKMTPPGAVFSLYLPASYPDKCESGPSYE